MSILEPNHCYSFSQLSTFDECPYSFYLQKIASKEEEIVEKENAFAQQGTLIHDLLDQWGKGILNRVQLPDEYVRRYPDEVTAQFPAVLASKGYAQKAYEQGLNYFSTFEGFPGYTIISSEEKFRTEIEGRPFAGVIDLVLKDNKTGKIVIVDHKSKSKTSFRKEEDRLYRQPYLYAKHVYEAYHVWPDELAFNLFKEGGLMMSRVFSKEQFDEIYDWAVRTIEKIESYDLLDWMNAKEKSDFFCQEICGVREYCPNGILK